MFSQIMAIPLRFFPKVFVLLLIFSAVEGIDKILHCLIETSGSVAVEKTFTFYKFT